MNRRERRPNPAIDSCHEAAIETLMTTFDDDQTIDYLISNATQSTAKFIATDAIKVERDNLPAAWTEGMYLPGRFEVEGLRMTLTSFPHDKLWMLSGSFWINNEEHSLAASAMGTKLTVDGFDGELVLAGDKDFAESILRGLLPRQDRDTIFDHAATQSEQPLVSILRELGETCGVFIEDHEIVVEDMEDIDNHYSDSRVTYAQVSRLESHRASGQRIMLKIGSDYGDGVTEHMWTMRRVVDVNGEEHEKISAYRVPSDIPIEDYALMHEFDTPSFAELRTADTQSAIGHVALFTQETLQRMLKRTAQE